MTNDDDYDVDPPSNKHDERVFGRNDIDSYDRSKFDHVFSGLSIWLEPEISPELQEEMSYLEQQCGGKECGVMPFVPHITLLYNINISKTTRTSSPSISPLANKGNGRKSSMMAPEQILEQCWDEFLLLQTTHAYRLNSPFLNNLHSL